MKDLKKITWWDHRSDSSWLDTEQIKEFAKDSSRSVCSSVGMITYEDANVIVVSSSEDGEGGYGENICLLKSAVIEIEEL